MLLSVMLSLIRILLFLKLMFYLGTDAGLDFETLTDNTVDSSLVDVEDVLCTGVGVEVPIGNLDRVLDADDEEDVHQISLVFALRKSLILKIILMVVSLVIVMKK